MEPEEEVVESHDNEETVKNDDEPSDLEVKIDDSFDFDRSPMEFCRTEFSVFTRGCKWSPDGTCNLVNCDNNYMTLFEVPDDPKQELKVAFKVRNIENICKILG